MGSFLLTIDIEWARGGNRYKHLQTTGKLDNCVLVTVLDHAGSTLLHGCIVVHLLAEVGKLDVAGL